MNIEEDIRRLWGIITPLKQNVAQITRLGVAEIWTPTPSGFSSPPGLITGRYVLIGKICTCFVYMNGAGTSNDTVFTLSAPFTATALGLDLFAWTNALTYAVNNGTAFGGGYASISNGASVISLFRAGGAAWTASGDKLAYFTLTYEIP